MSYGKSASPKHIISFDIETLPDVSLISNLIKADAINSFFNGNCIGSCNDENTLSIFKRFADLVQSLFEDINVDVSNGVRDKGVINITEDEAKKFVEACDEWQKCLLIEWYHVFNYKNAFPRQLFHVVHSLSVVYGIVVNGKVEIKKIATISRGDLEKISTIDDAIKAEAAIISLFKERVNKLSCNSNDIRFVSFNGSTFDVPVLKFRAMKNGIAFSSLFGYSMSRYQEGHVDVLDKMRDHNPMINFKLSEVCAMLNIPCKYSGSGNEVLQMFKDGNVEGIDRYCEIDALVTFLAYVRFYETKGEYVEGSYNAALKSLNDYVVQEKKDGGEMSDIIEFMRLHAEMDDNAKQHYALLNS
ncbi:3'-5' exonuclease [Rickettsiales bacterium]|nr:3'-5' exonuclease [Rickettsiales bacterium]